MIIYSITNSRKRQKHGGGGVWGQRYPDERAGDGDERRLHEPAGTGTEHHDVRAGSGHQEEPERDDAADVEVLTQRVGHAGQPDCPRRPHDRRAPASCSTVRGVFVVVRPAAVTVAVAMAMDVAVVVVVVAAVRARGYEHGTTRAEKPLSGARLMGGQHQQ
ncbi:hypothetical protein SORBI_3010G240600 [Sorghum bicolor]|uniref:Uncharacterized protein n=1 Tax=Sorghum bicolor TaxID=4558 RepID=A0A194YL38_SORBI|nr:hypothetical protein SORBI_3010G240600 [Sorghum bicolor]